MKKAAKKRSRAKKKPARKAVKTGKRKSVSQKRTKTRKRNTAAKQAAQTRKRKAAAQKAARTRHQHQLADLAEAALAEFDAGRLNRVRQNVMRLLKELRDEK